MTLKRIGVLGLQGDVAEHRAAFGSLGAASTIVRHPSDLIGLEGLVVPGGESTTISRLAVDLGMLEPIRNAIAKGLPTLGTCAGMILLARSVLGGRKDQEQFGGINITVRRNAFGRQVDSFEADVSMPAIGDEPFRGVFIRAPWVEEIGADVEVLGRLDWGDEPTSSGNTSNETVSNCRIVAVRQDAVIATSFHPELTHDYRMHELLLQIVG